MLTITLSDLMYRRRQFLIAVVGAALVFAMTLLLAGLTNGFGVEIDQSVAGFGADAWVVASGSAGRVASLAPMPAAVVAQVATAPGVRTATPVVVLPQTASVDGKLQQVATPEALYARPANSFVAHFLGSPGMNLVEGMRVENASPDASGTEVSSS